MSGLERAWRQLDTGRTASSSMIYMIGDLYGWNGIKFHDLHDHIMSMMYPYLTLFKIVCLCTCLVVSTFPVMQHSLSNTANLSMHLSCCVHVPCLCYIPSNTTNLLNSCDQIHMSPFPLFNFVNGYSLLKLTTSISFLLPIGHIVYRSTPNPCHSID